MTKHSLTPGTAAASFSCKSPHATPCSPCRQGWSSNSTAHQGGVGVLWAHSPNPDAFAGQWLRKGPHELHAACLGCAVDGREGHWVQAPRGGIYDNHACRLLQLISRNWPAACVRSDARMCSHEWLLRHLRHLRDLTEGAGPQCSPDLVHAFTGSASNAQHNGTGQTLLARRALMTSSVEELALPSTVCMRTMPEVGRPSSELA